MTIETEGYYDQILAVTKDYLGPATERFINRQIVSHLRKDPEALQRSDIPGLAIRIRSGLLVLTSDESLVEEAYRRINALTDSQD